MMEQEADGSGCCAKVTKVPRSFRKKTVGKRGRIIKDPEGKEKQRIGFYKEESEDQNIKTQTGFTKAAVFIWKEERRKINQIILV